MPHPPHAGHGTPSGAPAPGAPDPTRLTDWHLVVLPRLLPTLSHVSLHDAEPDGGWMHRRALAHLGRCRWVNSVAGYGFPVSSQWVARAVSASGIYALLCGCRGAGRCRWVRGRTLRADVWCWVMCLALWSLAHLGRCRWVRSLAHLGRCRWVRSLAHLGRCRWVRSLAHLGRCRWVRSLAHLGRCRWVRSLAHLGRCRQGCALLMGRTQRLALYPSIITHPHTSSALDGGLVGKRPVAVYGLTGLLTRHGTAVTQCGC